MTLEEAIEMYTSNAEYERTHGNLQGCLEFRQLAEWLKELKAYKEQGEDYISRNAAIIRLSHNKIGDDDCDVIIQKDIETIKALPPVTPQPKVGHCKDCRWWKDSDGLYRRGVHAESQCPINRREVFEGNGYCYMFEPYKAGSEDK